MFSFDLNSYFLRISFVEPTRDGWREKHNRGEGRGEHGGNKTTTYANAFEDFLRDSESWFFSRKVV